MSSVRTRPRWFFLITPRWLAWHAFVVVAFVGMLWLGDWQFRRAESGNALSWAYTFEWPIFAVLGVAFWVKTIIDEMKPAAAPKEAEEVSLPPGAGHAAAATGSRTQATADSLAGASPAGAAGAAAEDDDPELAAYNDYLARLNDQVKGHGRWHGLR
ncbi:MAG: hypothetical protein ACLQDY_19170 [Streptosporangiaceae bacterium]